jgi:RNA polymerase sigma-32 factor
VTEMERRLAAQDLPFEVSPGSDGEESWGPAAYLPAPGADPAEQIENEEFSAASSDALAAAVRSLDARSRDILEQRWMAPRKATLHELAARYGVSAERIRQIESTAIARLRRMLPAPEAASAV